MRALDYLLYALAGFGVGAGTVALIVGVSVVKATSHFTETLIYRSEEEE